VRIDAYDIFSTHFQPETRTEPEPEMTAPISHLLAEGRSVLAEATLGEWVASPPAGSWPADYWAVGTTADANAGRTPMADQVPIPPGGEPFYEQHAANPANAGALFGSFTLTSVDRTDQILVNFTIPAEELTTPNLVLNLRLIPVCEALWDVLRNRQQSQENPDA
jgi:hypothetical protein